MANSPFVSHMRASARAFLVAAGEPITYVPKGVYADQRTVTAIVKRAQPDLANNVGRSLGFEVHVEDHATRGTDDPHSDDRILVPEVEDGSKVIEMRFKRVLRRKGRGFVVMEFQS